MPKDFYILTVVGAILEFFYDRVNIHIEAVRRDLHERLDASREIVDETTRIPMRPLPNVPSDNKLRIGVYCRPGPNVANIPAFLVGSNVALFSVAEGPYLIALDANAA